MKYLSCHRVTNGEPVGKASYKINRILALGCIRWTCGVVCNALALCTNPQGFYSRTVAEVGDNGSATWPLKPRQPPSLALGRSSPGGFCTREFEPRPAGRGGP